MGDVNFSLIILALLIMLALFIAAIVFVVKGKIIVPFIMFTLSSVIFTILAWNHSESIYIGLIFAFIFITAFILTVIIIALIKKKKVKAPLITLLSTLITFSLIAGSVAFGDYQKDKWFYEFKNQIIKQYPVVKSVGFNPGNSSTGPTFNLYFYCDKNTSKEDFETVFNATKDYLFNHPSGVNPSQQSRINRGNGEYTDIKIYFYIGKASNAKAEVIYTASYYDRSKKPISRQQIDNFKTWRVSEG